MPTWLQKHIDHRHHHFDGMQAFYINALFRALVLALVGIFTPIFVYQLTSAVTTQTYALISVASYFLLMRLTSALVTLPASKIIEKAGFRKSVLFSVFLLFSSIIFLYFAEENLLFLPIASVFTGLNIPFYWVSRHSVIAIDSKKGSLGKQMGFLSVLERMSSVLGPVSGGFIVTIWGFHALYGTALVLLIASVVPLFSMPHHVHRNGVSLRGFLHWVGDRQFFHQAIGAVSRAIDDYGVNFIWPFAIFFMGISIVAVGSIYSALNIVSTIIRYVTGNVFDKLYGRKDYSDEIMFGVSAIFNSITWIARIFLTSISSILLVDGVLGASGTTYRNLSDDYFYLGGKRMSEIAYVSYRGLMYSLASVALMLLWIVGIYLGNWKAMLFIVISVWSLIGAIQARESNLK